MYNPGCRVSDTGRVLCGCLLRNSCHKPPGIFLGRVLARHGPMMVNSARSLLYEDVVHHGSTVGIDDVILYSTFNCIRPSARHWFCMSTRRL